jgi:hypothetical protein
MGFFLEFDAPNNTVRLTYEATVTQEDIGGKVYAALTAFVTDRPPCKGIIDLTHVTSFEASNDIVKERTRLPSAVPGGLMRVFVAPKDHLYGLSRMFSLMASETRPNLHVVRTMDEAYALLEIQVPQFTRVNGS